MILLMVLGTASYPVSLMAQVDCSKLDPRESVSTEKEGEIKASINTLYKIAKAGGSVRAKAIENINNLQKGVPVTEKALIKLRTLFLFCGMFANDKEISPERKVKLYKEMMEVNAADKPKSQLPAQKKKTKGSNPTKRAAATDSAENKVATPSNPQTNLSVSSQGQLGGITAQNVIITKFGGTELSDLQRRFPGGFKKFAVQLAGGVSKGGSQLIKDLGVYGFDVTWGETAIYDISSESLTMKLQNLKIIRMETTRDGTKPAGEININGVAVWRIDRATKRVYINNAINFWGYVLGGFVTSDTNDEVEVVIGLQKIE